MCGGNVNECEVTTEACTARGIFEKKIKEKMAGVVLNLYPLELLKLLL